MRHEVEKSSSGGPWFDSAVYYWTTAAIVVLGVCLGHFYLASSRQQYHFHAPHGTDLAAAFANWDGQWYLRIARDGYFYDQNAASSVAFFPAFPLAGRYLAWITGLDYDLALTLVANVAFFLALWLFGVYIRQRPGCPIGPASYAPLVMALFPPGFFFRMAYSESLFLLLAILIFCGLVRQWPILLVAALVGLATATRAVGVALLPPLMVAGWRHYSHLTHLKRKIATLAAAALLCIWGLAVFMIFQYICFGDALAFAKAHAHWHFRDQPSRHEQLLSALILEPFWSVYDESSLAYWRQHDHELGPAFSLQFANPIYFAFVAGLIGYGAWRHWLTAEEILFAAGGLLIPYLSRGHEVCMSGHARHTLAVFPAYLVLGRLLAALPQTYAAVILALFGSLLGTSAALFAGWFLFI